MKTRYRLIRRGVRGGGFYCVDNKTGKRTSLRTGSEDHVTPSNQDLRAVLAERGIAVDYRETPGGHSWFYWSHQIAPMLVAIDRHFHPAE